MNRTIHRPSNALPALPARRAGTPVIAVVALAAACVLAACGPEEQTVATLVPATTTTTTTTVVKQNNPVQYTSLPRNDGTAATVPSGHVAQVADRDHRAAPQAIYGRVSSIEPITQTPRSSGAGAVVGGVLGAVVGNQIGSGNGRTAATVLGGVGGAVVGNKVEKNRSETVTGYRVHVQLDNGSSRSFERTSLDGLDVGDRVRIEGSRLREV